MDANITVLTSITGGKDSLIDQQAKGKAKWIAFANGISKTWKLKKPYDRFKDERRNSRIMKLLSHQFCDTEYSIWIDGNIQLLKPPEEIIKRYLNGYDMAVFKHSLRDCIYGEATKCAISGLDDPEIIIEQVSKYEKEGYGKNKGLCECGVLIRRHTPKVKEFNNFWWSEYCKHSVRDQISFMYAVDSTGIRVNMIDEKWGLSPDGLSGFRSDFIKIFPHIISNPIVK